MTNTQIKPKANRRLAAAGLLAELEAAHLRAFERWHAWKGSERTKRKRAMEYIRISNDLDAAQGHSTNADYPEKISR